jgi:ATP-dependent DNA helicase RecQ
MKEASPAVLLELARAHFGHHTLRPGQAEAIAQVLGGQDVLIVMPTGGGKSLCYQLPALLGPGLTVVVSPLIALMKDQVDALRAHGVAAAALHSLQPRAEAAAVLQAVAQGRLRLLYVSPERLAAPALRAALARRPLARLVVDEAHCVISWGPDFRPDYLALGELSVELGRPPLVALTATATSAEQGRILAALGRPEARRVVTGFDRPELYHAMVPVETPSAKLATLGRALRQVGGPAVIYTATRSQSEALARQLVEVHGWPAAAYHAGLPAAVRLAVQDAFLADRLHIVCATSAFGLGVDKPDVRAVVHWALPFDVTAYTQAAGRAGRDGAAALSLLLVDEEDRRLREWQIAAAVPSPADLGGLCAFLARPASPHRPADDDALAAAAGLPVLRLRAGLAALARAGIAQRVGGGGGPWVLTRPPRPGELERLGREALARAGERRAALRELVELARGDHCRRQALLEHFGERRPAPGWPCCDVCHRRGARAPRRARPATPAPAPAALDPPPGAADAAAAGGAGAFELLLLQAILEHDGQTTLRSLATRLAADRRAAQPPPAAVTTADLQAAVGRLMAAGLVVAHYGHGPTRLALTRAGQRRVQAGSRVAERPAAYLVRRRPADLLREPQDRQRHEQPTAVA